MTSSAISQFVYLVLAEQVKYLDNLDAGDRAPLPDFHRLLHAGAEEKWIAAAANPVVFKNGTVRERHDEMERRAAHGLAVVVAGN